MAKVMIKVAQLHK